MADTSPDPIMTPQGKAIVVDPWGGIGSVWPEDLAIKLQQGYRFATQADNDRAYHQQTEGEQPVLAAGEGFLRGLTAGISDIGAPEDVGLRRELNPRAAVVGQVAGTLAPVGFGSVLHHTANAVAGAAGGGTAGRILGTAAEGGLIGVGQAVSDVALSRDPMNAEAVAGVFLHHALVGTALGAAGGAIGEVASRAATKVQGKLQDLADTYAAKAAAPAQAAVDKAALEAERLQLLDDVRALRPDLKKLRTTELGTRFESADAELKAAVKASERRIAGFVGQPSTFADTPEAATKIKNAITDYRMNLQQVIGTEPQKAAESVLTRAGAIEQRLGKLATPPPAPVEAAPSIAGDVIKGVAKHTIGGAVYSLANAAAGAVGLPGAGLVAHLFAGSIIGKVGNLLSGQLVGRAAEVGARIAGAAARLLGDTAEVAPAIGGHLTHGAVSMDEAFSTMRERVLAGAANPAAARLQLEAKLEGLRPIDPVFADQVGALALKGWQHLAEVLPKSGGSPTLARGDAPVSPMQRDRWLRRAEVVIDPTVLLDHVMAGTLTPTMVESADAVYGNGIMPILRQRILEALADKKVPTSKRLVLTMLLGAPVTPSLRADNIAAMQQRITQEIQNQASPPQPGAMPKPEEQTASQRFTGGI